MQLGCNDATTGRSRIALVAIGHVRLRVSAGSAVRRVLRDHRAEWQDRSHRRTGDCSAYQPDVIAGRDGAVHRQQQSGHAVGFGPTVASMQVHPARSMRPRFKPQSDRTRRYGWPGGAQRGARTRRAVISTRPSVSVQPAAAGCRARQRTCQLRFIVDPNLPGT